jgi:hypothetical protein
MESILPDYITLYRADAYIEHANHVMVWNIPNSYYTNVRGSVCYVELVQGIVRETVSNDLQLTIKMVGGVQNQQTTKNDGSILGVVGVQSTAGSHKDLYQPLFGEPIKCLISSRPNTIKLQVCEIDNDPITLDNGIFVLKFTYFNDKKTSEGLAEQRQPNL